MFNNDKKLFHVHIACAFLFTLFSEIREEILIELETKNLKKKSTLPFASNLNFMKYYAGCDLHNYSVK